ncbi:MAG: 5,10-methylenetetrahydrofolate reductase, partial [Candidatus Poribacteria bacterium]
MSTPLREVLKSGKFVTTAEVGPPKGTNIETMLHHIDLLKDKVDALNATDNQSSVMRFPSLATTFLIKEKGA